MVLAAEKYSETGTSEYFAVMGVKKEFCDGKKATFLDLKGKGSCHTGYRRSAGWNANIGFYLDSGALKLVDKEPTVLNDAESAAAFFGKVCAPRPSANGPVSTPDGNGATWAGTCSACKGDCTDADPYHDYAGAFRCLTEGAGSVAFVKHSTMMDFAKGGKSEQSWSTKTVDEYMLICPDGSGCKPVSDYKKCARLVPAHATLTRSSNANASQIASALSAAAADPAVRAKVFDAKSNPNNYLFKYSAVSVEPYSGTTKEFLGEYYNSVRGLEESSGAPTPASGAPAPESGGGGLSGGAIAGIVIGTLAGVAILIGGVFWLRQRSAYNANSGAVANYVSSSKI